MDNMWRWSCCLHCNSITPDHSIIKLSIIIFITWYTLVYLTRFAPDTPPVGIWISCEPARCMWFLIVSRFIVLCRIISLNNDEVCCMFATSSPPISALSVLNSTPPEKMVLVEKQGWTGSCKFTQNDRLIEIQMHVIRWLGNECIAQGTEKKSSHAAKRRWRRVLWSRL